MWTVNITERDNGTYDVAATHAVVDAEGKTVGLAFSYSSTIRKTDAAAFVAKCKSLLTNFQTNQTAIQSAKTKLEAALNS